MKTRCRNFCLLTVLYYCIDCVSILALLPTGTVLYAFYRKDYCINGTRSYLNLILVLVHMMDTKESPTPCRYSHCQ